MDGRVAGAASPADWRAAPCDRRPALGRAALRDRPGRSGGLFRAVRPFRLPVPPPPGTRAAQAPSRSRRPVGTVADSRGLAARAAARHAVRRPRLHRARPLPPRRDHPARSLLLDPPPGLPRRTSARRPLRGRRGHVVARIPPGRLPPAGLGASDEDVRGAVRVIDRASASQHKRRGCL